jgi:hypothetical protein
LLMFLLLMSKLLGLQWSSMSTSGLLMANLFLSRLAIVILL